MSVPMVTAMNALRMSKLADYLRRELRDRNWTRQYAADRAGVSKTTITEIVNGKQRADLGTLAALANGFEVPLARLIELCGYELPPLKATRLTDEEEQIIANLTPTQRDAVLAVAKEMLQSSQPPANGSQSDAK